MDFLKKEKKFVGVLAITLLLLAGLHMTALSGLQNDSENAKKKGTAAWKQWADSVKALHTSIKDTKKIQVGSEEIQAEGYKVSQLTALFRTQIDRLEDVKDVILSRLEWQPGAEFRLRDEGSEELRQVTQYQSDVQSLMIALSRRYTNSGDYAYVAKPSLADTNLNQQFGFDIYIGEAPAWAGLVQPKAEDDSPRGGMSRFGRGRSRGAEPEEEEDEDEKERKERLEARARASLNLVLLSIANKVIEAGRAARVSRVETMGFVGRPEKMKKRFGVVEDAASFYRPVCFFVSMSTDEASLMRFLDNCVQADFGGEKSQFLAIEEVTINAPNCLEPQPADQNVSAEVMLVAWLVDTDSAFSLEKKTDRGTRSSGRFGSRRYR